MSKTMKVSGLCVCVRVCVCECECVSYIVVTGHVVLTDVKETNVKNDEGQWAVCMCACVCVSVSVFPTSLSLDTWCSQM